MKLFKDYNFIFKGKKVKITGKTPKIKCIKNIDDFKISNEPTFKDGNIYSLNSTLKDKHSIQAPYYLDGNGINIYIGKFKNVTLDAHFELVEDKNFKIFA